MFKIEKAEGYSKRVLLEILKGLIQEDVYDNQAYTVDEDGCIVTYLGFTIEQVHSEGGYEGSGEYAYSVFKISDGENSEYLKYEYNYYSHYGLCLDSATISKVVSKKVTVEKWVKE